MKLTWFLILSTCLACSISIAFAGTPEEEEGVKYADRCEACKILAIELQDRLTETGKSHDVIEMGWGKNFHKSNPSIDKRIQANI